MMRKLLLAGFALALALPAAASELDLSLGDDVFRATFITPMDARGRDGGTILELGGLLSEQRGSDAVLAHGGLLVYGDAGARKASVQAGVGARAVFLDADPDLTGFALSLGGAVAARLPSYNRIGASLWAYYSPKVTAFEDLEGYLEYGVTVDYQLIRRASLYGGLRRIRLDFANGADVRLDDGFHGGIRLSF